MADVYANFRELQEHEQEGRDYLIKTSRNWQPVLIAAPHGGNIEPFTSVIAQWIAGQNLPGIPLKELRARGFASCTLPVIILTSLCC